MNDPSRTEVFIALFAAHERRIYRYILTLLPDDAAAQDVLQEAALSLWQKWSEYREDQPFMAWASQFARYKVLNYYKRSSRYPALLGHDVVNLLAEEQTAKEDWFGDQLKALAGCLQNLTDRERRLIEARYHHETTIAEMAEQWGQPADSLYKALYRMRKKLMRCVERTLILWGET